MWIYKDLIGQSISLIGVMILKTENLKNLFTPFTCFYKELEIEGLGSVQFLYSELNIFGIFSTTTTIRVSSCDFFNYNSRDSVKILTCHLYNLT